MFMTSTNSKTGNREYILLNNVGSKHSLFINLASLCQIMRKIPIKNILQRFEPEISYRLFYGIK